MYYYYESPRPRRFSNNVIDVLFKYKFMVHFDTYL